MNLLSSEKYYKSQQTNIYRTEKFLRAVFFSHSIFFESKQYRLFFEFFFLIFDCFSAFFHFLFIISCLLNMTHLSGAAFEDDFVSVYTIEQWRGRRGEPPVWLTVYS